MRVSLDAGKGSEPRYQLITDLLMQEITSGKYSVGTLLPPEVELAAHHGVSRHTVREAIRRLTEMGLVGRRQGVGTRIDSTVPRDRVVASLGSIADLYSYTQRTRVSLLSEHPVVADTMLAETLQCDPGQKWIRFETTRAPLEANSAPLSYNEIYALPAQASLRDGLEGEGVWIYGLIEQKYRERVTEVRQEIGTTQTSTRIAKLVKCRPRVPALQVIRHYFGKGGRLLLVSVNTYPENRFRLSMRWSLE